MLKQGVLFSLAQIIDFAQFSSHVTGCSCHFLQQVVGIHNGPFAGFHLAFRKFNHSIAEVMVFFGTIHAELLQNGKEDLEMVLLFVSYRVDLAFQAREIAVPEDGGSDVLRHVDSGSVLAQEQFFVQTLVAEVDPNAAVVLFEKHTSLQTSSHLVFSEQVGVRFIVEFIKIDAHLGVRFTKAVVDPVVHGAPQFDHFGLALFPAVEHGLRFEQDWRLLFGLIFDHASGYELRYLFFESAVEGHVVFPHQLIALQPGRVGGFSVAEFLPGDHGFADVDAAVVDDLDLDDLVSCCF